MASSTLLPVALVCVLPVSDCSPLFCVCVPDIFIIPPQLWFPLSSFPLYTSLISSPSPPQNQGHPFPVSSGVIPPSASQNRAVTCRPWRWLWATSHPQWELSEPGSQAWARCQLTTERQLGPAEGERAGNQTLSELPPLAVGSGASHLTSA